MKNRIDIQQEVTDQIVARIEQGGLPPWVCPWTKTGEPAIPYNFTSKRSYNGINILVMWMRAMDQGYTSNAWLTFNQARELGGKVRKGEKATRCVFYKPIVLDEEDSKQRKPVEDGDSKRILNYQRVFPVFNVDQIDGLDDIKPSTDQQVFDSGEVAVEKISSISSAYSTATGVDIAYGGDLAYYSPSSDMIRLPNTFHCEVSYAATLAHEMIHSTGHQSRLNRFDQQIGDFKDKKKSYAFEELVAEIGAAFMCAELGIDSSHEQHASYLDHWLEQLKKDKKYLFKAAAASAKAHAYIMSVSSTLHRDSNDRQERVSVGGAV